MKILEPQQLSRIASDLAAETSVSYETAYAALRNAIGDEERRGVYAAEKVFTAIGEASMCWERVSHAGEFKSLRAAEIGQRLLIDLGYPIPEEYRDRKPQPAWDPTTNPPVTPINNLDWNPAESYSRLQALPPKGVEIHGLQRSPDGSLIAGEGRDKGYEPG